MRKRLQVTSSRKHVFGLVVAVASCLPFVSAFGQLEVDTEAPSNRIATNLAGVTNQDVANSSATAPTERFRCVTGLGPRSRQVWIPTASGCHRSSTVVR